jgi:hypothetical protein
MAYGGLKEKEEEYVSKLGMSLTLEKESTEPCNDLK